MVSIDDMIQMVTNCYFTGKCKICPFYKAPKFGTIGSCVGSKKVGNELLDWFLYIKAKEELAQMELPLDTTAPEDEVEGSEENAGGLEEISEELETDRADEEGIDRLEM